MRDRNHRVGHPRNRVAVAEDRARAVAADTPVAVIRDPDRAGMEQHALVRAAPCAAAKVWDAHARAPAALPDGYPLGAMVVARQGVPEAWGADGDQRLRPVLAADAASTGAAVAPTARAGVERLRVVAVPVLVPHREAW